MKLRCAVGVEAALVLLVAIILEGADRVAVLGKGSLLLLKEVHIP